MWQHVNNLHFPSVSYILDLYFMHSFYKKFISTTTLLTVFLLGNMAMVHAWSTSHTEIVSHSHDGITESHIVETSDDTEPPHCTQTKTDRSTPQQIRDNDDLSDIIQKAIPFYSKPDSGKVEAISSDVYIQYYPWSKNNFFWHLLVGEKIILV